MDTTPGSKIIEVRLKRSSHWAFGHPSSSKGAIALHMQSKFATKHTNWNSAEKPMCPPHSLSSDGRYPMVHKSSFKVMLLIQVHSASCLLVSRIFFQHRSNRRKPAFVWGPEKRSAIFYKYLISYCIGSEVQVLHVVNYDNWVCHCLVALNSFMFQSRSSEFNEKILNTLWEDLQKEIH